jgi:hypothetical protein
MSEFRPGNSLTGKPLIISVLSLDGALEILEIAPTCGASLIIPESPLGDTLSLDL